MPSTKTVSFFRLFFLLGAGLFVVLSGAPFASAQTVLPEEALADLIKPSIVRIAEHVSGTAKIPEIKVDIRQRLVAVVPGAYTEVPVDEYLIGSGFIIHTDGYIATNSDLKIPEIKVDIRQRLVAVVPGAYTEVPVDEYLIGSGFIIHTDGYIATNAHVVSE